MRLVVAAGLLATALAGCGAPPAPFDEGLPWKVAHDAAAAAFPGGHLIYVGTPAANFDGVSGVGWQFVFMRTERYPGDLAIVWTDPQGRVANVTLDRAGAPLQLSFPGTARLSMSAAAAIRDAGQADPEVADAIELADSVALGLIRDRWCISPRREGLGYGWSAEVNATSARFRDVPAYLDFAPGCAPFRHERLEEGFFLSSERGGWGEHQCSLEYQGHDRMELVLHVGREAPLILASSITVVVRLADGREWTLSHAFEPFTPQRWGTNVTIPHPPRGPVAVEVETAGDGEMAFTLSAVSDGEPPDWLVGPLPTECARKRPADGDDRK